MRMMHLTLFRPAVFQLAAIVLLAIVPVIFATPSPELLSPRGVEFRDLKPPNYNQWPGLGCFTDDNDQPALTSVLTSASLMTVGECVSTCFFSVYKLAGVVNGQDCRCGNVTAASAQSIKPALCNITCPGNQDENCGGTNAIAIYSKGSPLQPQPTFVQNVGPWTLSGCFADSDTAKTLAVQKSGLGGQFNNTVENCLDACGAASYKYAGVEGPGGKFCWCDNQINQGRTALPYTSPCTSSPCPGNNNEFCGGPHSLVIYKRS